MENYESIEDSPEFKSFIFGPGSDVEIDHYMPGKESTKELYDHIRKETENKLINKEMSHIVGALSKVSEKWSNNDYKYRKIAVETLPKITNYSRETVETALDYFSNLYSKGNLMKTVKTELGNEFLGEWAEKEYYEGKIKAIGPEEARITTNIFAGNVPGIPSLDIVRSLLVKQGSVSKVSSQEPLFPKLFLKSIGEVDEELADTIALVYWDRDSEGFMSSFRSTDNLVAYGGLEAINSFSEIAEEAEKENNNLNFIPHGHKMSALGIGKNSFSGKSVEEIAEKAALDASIWDQQGCLSPQAVYVERGGEVTPQKFAEKLYEKMVELERDLPLGKLTFEEKSNLRETLDNYEFKEAMGDAKIYSSEGGVGGTVIYEEGADFEPTCLFRTIKVVPINDFKEIEDIVDIDKDHLQTFGLEAEKDRIESISDKLAFTGFDRISKLGEMGFPKAGSSHDGRYGLRDLLRTEDWRVISIEGI